jgi:kynureninase
MRPSAPEFNASHDIAEAIARLDPGPLTEEGLRIGIWPLFSRVIAASGDQVYLANHSLGRPLDRTSRDVQLAIDAWATRLDEAWGVWLEGQSRFCEGVARLIGAPGPDHIVFRTSAGQALRAVLSTYDRPIHVVTTRGEFDSIDFILKAHADRQRAHVTWVEPDSEGLFHASDLRAAITEQTDLVVVSSVFFQTGQVLDGLEEIVAIAHAGHARVLVDTYHAAGVLPLDVTALGVDYAVGGSYKYLRGAAGACWLYVSPRVLEESRQPLETGWFAKASPFQYARPENALYADGIGGWQESTPPILVPFQALAGLELVNGLGVGRLRAYSLHQQRELIRLFREAGIPAQGGSSDRGAFVVVRHERAFDLALRLRELGVVTDARGVNWRFCPDILNSRSELAEAVLRVARLVESLPSGR